MNIESNQIDNRRHILFILAYFPPYLSVGVWRNLALIKYFVEKNWKVTVVTLPDNLNWTKDYNLCAQVPSQVAVIRTLLWSPANRFWRETNNLHYETKPIRKKEKIFSPAANSLKIIFYKGIQNWFIPDLLITWFPTALLRVLKLFSTERFDLIYSSSPPETVHLIALILSKISRIPWISDFRDAWTTEPNRPNYNKIRIKIESILESSVIKRSSRVITVSDGISGDLGRWLENEAKKKIIMISNGYDVEDFINLPKVELPNSDETKVKFLYTGTLGGKRTGRRFFEAIRILIDKNPSFTDKFHVYFVGRISDEECGYAYHLGLEKQISFLGVFTHKQTLAYQVSADILVLIISEQSTSTSSHVLTGKMFEYIGAKKPIFAIIPEGGVAAKLIEENNLGWVVDPESPDSISIGLSKTLSGFVYKANSILYDEKYKLFERRAYLEKLYVELEKIKKGN